MPDERGSGSEPASPASTVALEPLAHAPPALRGLVPQALASHVRPGDERLNPAQYLRILARRAHRASAAQ